MAFYLRPNSQVMTDTDGNMFAELYADEETDLADNLEGVDLAAGSIALVIASGDFYVLNSSSEWVNVTTKAEPNASVNSTRGEQKMSTENLDEIKNEPEEETEEVKEVEDDGEMGGSAESEQRTTRKR